MQKFQLQVFKGHPIISDGENTILIDTGAPVTLHTAGSLDFCADTYPCSLNLNGMTIENISDMLGMPITTLLGGDVLSHYSILFDYINQEVTFSKQDIPLKGTTSDITLFMGIPIIQMQLNHQDVKFFLDTGAMLSYISNTFTNGTPSVGMEEDFLPGYGVFQTPCFHIVTTIGSDEFVVKYGNLPSLLQMTLMLGGVKGIMGYDLFKNFKVLVDYRNKQLKFSKYTT